MEETPSEQFQSKTTDTMYVFYGFKDSSGYGYIFPKKDHLNIGIGILWPFFKQKIHDKPYRVYKQFLDFLSKNNYVKGQSQRRNFHGYFLPVGGPLQRTFTHRVLLCGDAAGFVNAFTGEGIYYAMVSGEHAAKVALRALERNDFSEKSLSTYQTNWQREIGKELEVSVAIQRESFKRRHLIDFIVKAAQKNDLLRRSLAEYATGELGYQELKRRAIFHFAPFYLEYKLRKIFQFTSKTG